MTNKKSGTEIIYQHHHSSSRKPGLSVLKEVRGNFLREHIGKGKTVLDIGCRDGALTETYAAGNTVLGIDIDTESLERASKNLNIKTKHTDLNGDWDIPQSHFDFVVAGEIIEHLYYPDIVLQKISVVLKPEGVLLGSVPNAFSLKNRIRLFFARKKHTPLADPTHINHFSYTELENLLKEQFTHVKIYSVGRFAWLDRFFPGLFSFNLFFRAQK